MCDTCGCKGAEDITLHKYPVKVISYSVDVHEDDYEQGEIGDSVHYWRVDENDLDFDTKAENEEELLQILNSIIRFEIGGKVPKHGKNNFGFELGKAYTDVHATYEEGQGMGLYDYPTEYEKKAWKRGEQELFSLGFIFNIEPVDDFYAERFDAPQATIDTQWAMKMIQSQYDNVGIDRVLSIREDFEGDLFITILLTNGNRQQLIIEKSQIGMIYDEDKGEYVRMGGEGFDAEMIIDTDKYEGYDNWEGTKVNMANRANVLLIADAPKILNAYKRLLAENRRLYERMNLAEEYIINPERWVSYSFEVLDKNLGENEEYMMDGLKTGHKFSYRDEMGAEGFSAENLSFKERIEKMIDVASPKFKGIKGFGKKIGAKQGKKLDYKIQGILPKAKGVSSYRRNIETPKWYKGIQLGLMTGLAGFITYKLATDDSKEE